MLKVRTMWPLTPDVLGLIVILYTTLVVVLSVERITQTVEITKHTVDIEEKGVKLKLTIVDTPGFGDAVNNTEWYTSYQQNTPCPLGVRLHATASTAEHPCVFLF